MLMKRALSKKGSYEISLKLDEKFSRGISFSSQMVFFQFLHYICLSGAICPLQVPGRNHMFANRFFKAFHERLGLHIVASIAGIHISEGKFAIDMLTALKPSLEHDHKHVVLLYIKTSRLHSSYVYFRAFQNTGGALSYIAR